MMTAHDILKLTLVFLAPLLAAIAGDTQGLIPPLLKLIAVGLSGSVASALAFTQRMGHRVKPKE